MAIGGTPASTIILARDVKAMGILSRGSGVSRRSAIARLSRRSELAVDSTAGQFATIGADNRLFEFEALGCQAWRWAW
jgi:hypothetical protein